MKDLTEWDSKPLSEIVDRPIAYGVLKPAEAITNGVQMFRIQDFDEDGRLANTELHRISRALDHEFRRTRLREGDLIISVVGTIGKVYEIPNQYSGANVSRAFCVVGIKERSLREFVKWYLRSPLVEKWIGVVAAGNAQKVLNVGTLSSLNIPIPNTVEREKISQILSAIERCIAGSGELLKLKCLQKQGLMQQLLTGKTRFKEFKGERWRKVGVSDVFEQVTRRNSTGCHRVLTGSGEHGLIDQRDYYSRRVASDDVSSYYLVKRGEFAYNRSSSNGYPFGAIKRLNDYEEGVLSTLYLVFRIRDGVPVDSNFLDHIFESGYFIAQLGRLCREGARSHGLLNITADEFFSMHMQLPGIKEQQRIEAVLSACDGEIELLEKQLERLKEQKRGLMQKLLTGEVRVKL